MEYDKVMPSADQPWNHPWQMQNRMSVVLIDTDCNVKAIKKKKKKKRVNASLKKNQGAHKP